MKRIILSLLVLLLLVGCGHSNDNKDIKKFSCTKTISDSISNVSYEINGEYQNNSLVKIESNSKMTFTSEGLDNLYIFKSYAESTKDEYNKKSGVEATIVSNDKEINLNIKYDVLNMTREEIINNNFDRDYNDLIKIYQSDEYTCK